MCSKKTDRTTANMMPLENTLLQDYIVTAVFDWQNFSLKQRKNCNQSLFVFNISAKPSSSSAQIFSVMILHLAKVNNQR